LRPPVADIQRRREHARTEADVREPVAVVDVHPYRHVRARDVFVRRAAPARTGAQRLGIEAERSDDAQQQSVLLEAIAAAARTNELRVDGGRRELDAHAEASVHRVVWNCRRMQTQHFSKRGQRGRARAGVADAPAISVEVHPRQRHVTQQQSAHRRADYTRGRSHRSPACMG
jgi:hypothetical protein